MHPSNPEKRQKLGWIKEHEELVSKAHKSTDVLMIGDSIIFNFKRYPKVWYKNFANLKNANYGIRGDCIQHVLWRIKFGLLPLAGLVLIHAGTNNLKKCEALEIAEGIVKIATAIKDRMPNVKIMNTGLLPRNGRNSLFRKEADSVNNHIENCLKDQPILFLKPGEHWTLPNGHLNPDLYYSDQLHLIEGGYNYFCECIKRLIFSVPLPSLPTSVVSPSLPVSSLLVTSCSVSKPVRRRVRRHHIRAPSSLYPPLKFVDFRFFDKLIS